MKVADNNVMGMEQGGEGAIDLGWRRNEGAVYASQRAREGGTRHDARGLVIAVLLCLLCWAALGFFLLS